MKLLYIWVEDYRCFKNQGFNFSSKQKFEYDKDNKILKCKENENYIEGLFNNLNNDNSKNIYGIEEITAIVGKNGSGKSTLLDLIINISDKLPHYKKQYLILILDEFNQINIISNINVDEIDKSQIRNYEINLNYKKDYSDEFDIIYHSNALEYQYYEPNNYMNVYDISTMGLMRDDNKRLYENNITNLNNNEIVSFFNEEFRRQVEFVCGFDDLGNYIDFKMPDSLNASFSDISNFKEFIYSRIDGKYIKKDIKNIINSVDKDESINRTFLRNLLKIDNKFNRINIKIKCNSMDSKRNLKKFKISLLEGIYFNALDCIIPYVIPLNNEQYKLINEILENKIILNIDSISTIEELWDSIENFLEELTIHDRLKFFKSEIYTSLKEFRENIEDVFIKQTKYKPWLFNSFILKVDKNTENNELYKVRSFYNLYKETVFKFNYIQFEWNMSNGENNLLNLFARFYSLIDTEKKDFKRYHDTKSMYELIILMDEADMSFHPEWQRKYIKLIIDFIQAIFSQYKVHLIITTHSPIMLSDIPSDNIIYLSKGVNISDKKDINNRTFAANIYNLYKEEFFFDGKNLNKHFGIIGEFASNKIEYVIKTLDKWEKFNSFTEEEQNEYIKKLNDCKKIINLIGEPLIRNMLENKYQIAEQNLNLKEDKESQLGEIINDFDRLSEEDRRKFLKHLIDKYK